MLATKAQYSLSNAEEYFNEHLQVGDYYMEGRRVMGEWIGQGAESLGLSGVTHTDEFLKLCRNLHPTTGERLTQRHNGTRMEAGKDGNLHEVANRRVFFDFTFSPPKSVSIAALVGDDRRILEAHDEAVGVAIRQLEMVAATRVRKDGETSYRLTGNLVGAVFRHDTSRALDPHLHSHCILFNATRDSVENRWKALEPYEMLMAKKFTVQVYYDELTKALVRFGYGIENNPRGDFEIRGVSQELIGRFSKRHQEIDRKTRELLDGFLGTQTLSAFLARGSLARGAVVVVDEAGQIGGRQMLELLRLVKENEGRVILSGDTHQHGAVEGTVALRAIERHSGLEYAELTNIRRQNPDQAKTQAERKWLEQYRLAVGEAQAGKLAQSFDRLDKQDAIVACTLANQQQKLTERFLELVKAYYSTVVVSQSWSEIHKVNERVRDGLKTQGLIGQEERVVTALERLDLTAAQKRDARSYAPDSVVVFNRPISGYKPGDTGRLLVVTDKHLLIEANQRIRPVPFKDLDRLTVCQPKELPLSSGDRLQLKANANATDGRKVVK